MIKSDVRVRVMQPVVTAGEGQFDPYPLLLPSDYKTLGYVPGWSLYYSGARTSIDAIAAETLDEIRSKDKRGVFMQGFVRGSGEPFSERSTFEELFKNTIVQLEKVRFEDIAALLGWLGREDRSDNPRRDLIMAVKTAIKAGDRRFDHVVAVQMAINRTHTNDVDFADDFLRKTTTVLRLCMVRNGTPIEGPTSGCWPIR